MRFLLDFMPVRAGTAQLVRIVRGVRGRVPMHMELVLRFDYGRSVPWVTRLQEGVLRAIAGPDMAVLTTTAPLRGENLKTLSDFAIREGDSPDIRADLRTFLRRRSPPAPIPKRRCGETVSFWQEWAGRAKLHGDYADAIERSLITLKALTYRHTGGMVAAPTTSLPEQLGGQRNWDYRYCWLRDATFTLLALMNAGYFEEAQAWRDWLLRAVAGSPDQVQIMYGIRGERTLLEWEIPLAGRIRGFQAGAGRQRRLRTTATGCLRRGGRRPATMLTSEAFHPAMATSTCKTALTDHLATIWDQPDHGIWEVRGEPQHFTYSKIMAWVAFDRASKVGREARPERRTGALAPASRPDPSRRVRKGLRPGTGQLHAGLRFEGTRRFAAADSAGWLPALRPIHASAARLRPSRSI